MQQTVIFYQCDTLIDRKVLLAHFYVNSLGHQTLDFQQLHFQLTSLKEMLVTLGKYKITVNF